MPPGSARSVPVHCPRLLLWIGDVPARPVHGIEVGCTLRQLPVGRVPGALGSVWRSRFFVADMLTPLPDVRLPRLRLGIRWLQRCCAPET
jgi:hypothetical protein